MVGSFLVRVPNQRHLALGSGDRVTVMCALIAVLYVFLLHVTMGLCVVSADTIDVLSTVFLCFTKAGRNFAQVQVFLGMHGSFLHFCEAGLNFAQRSH